MLTVGSLFAGVGGFDLGLERAGMRTVWFCEQDEFCRAVLAKHWPGVPCYPDVRRLRFRDDGPGGTGEEWDWVGPVDVLCGGFPCQDLSLAGKGAGIDGQRSGLWGEYARLIRELRPRYVVVENVAALLGRGLGRVLGDLAACGYDAEWDCVPASAVGAPHRRDRLWIVAYPNGERGNGSGQLGPGRGQPADGGSAGGMGHTDGASEDPHAAPGGPWPATGERGWWEFEPAVGRVANGIPNRVDRLAALGNALVPQIAEWLGRRIVETEENRG